MKTSDNTRHQIVQVKGVNSQTNGKYTVTLEVVEWIFKDTPYPGMYHVTPNYLLAINQILEDQFDELNA